MTSRSSTSKEVTNPRNVSKAERKKAAEQLQALEHGIMEKERWKNRNKYMIKRWPWLKEIDIPGESVKRKTKSKRRRVAKGGGKIMAGYKAGGKV
jgi:hypothetical protein|tara:strand:- start:408 stop:692 length:285 start_codon:yes stop_codon:yes gene_type:complete